MRTIISNLNKYDILLKPCWTYKDIMNYFDIKSTATAVRLKNRAVKEFSGSVPYGSNYVKTDSVLSLFGTCREQEVKVLKQIVNDEKELQKVDI